MEITSSYQNQGKVLVVDVGTKFDFSKVEDFRNAYGELGADVSHITVDLSRTEYMDSSALGMLLNMQKTLAERELTYSIENDKKFDIK